MYASVMWRQPGLRKQPGQPAGQLLVSRVCHCSRCLARMCRRVYMHIHARTHAENTHASHKRVRGHTHTHTRAHTVTRTHRQHTPITQTTGTGKGPCTHTHFTRTHAHRRTHRRRADACTHTLHAARQRRKFVHASTACERCVRACAYARAQPHSLGAMAP